MSTGYFGIPGSYRAGDQTKVHFVWETDMLRRRPICGARMRPTFEFQWCSAGFNRRYVECGRCKIVARKALLKEMP
jgi:hypothetical protein